MALAPAIVLLMCSVLNLLPVPSSLGGSVIDWISGTTSILIELDLLCNHLILICILGVVHILRINRISKSRLSGLEVAILVVAGISTLQLLRNLDFDGVIVGRDSVLLSSLRKSSLTSIVSGGTGSRPIIEQVSMLSSRVLDIPRIERHPARGNLLVFSIIGRSCGSSKLWSTLSRSAVFTSTTRLDRGYPVQLVYVCKVDLISDITNAVLAQLKVAASASLNNTGVMLRAFIALGSVYRNLLPLGVRHVARV
jgi:hypothetical protein